MKKYVINKCFGGFSLSHLPVKMLYEKKNIPIYFYKKDETSKKPEWHLVNEVKNDESYIVSSTYMGESFGKIMPKNYEVVNYYFIDRADEDLVSVVETLGDDANTSFSRLKIVEIPDECADNVYIDEYDGIESVHENHMSWQ